jgi:hypothetical protein
MFRIGNVAAACGVSPQTLKQWLLRHGNHSGFERAGDGWRNFTECEAVALIAITVLIGFGIGSATAFRWMEGLPDELQLKGIKGLIVLWQEQSTVPDPAAIAAGVPASKAPHVVKSGMEWLYTPRSIVEHDSLGDVLAKRKYHGVIIIDLVQSAERLRRAGKITES